MKPAPRETFHSFLSRVAWSKGVAAPEFVADIGAAWRGAVTLGPSAVELISSALMLTEDELSDCLSWSGIPQGNVRIHFRGYDYISRSLRNPVVRGCPCCLRQDLEGSPEALHAAAVLVMRGDWQLREASLCLMHERLLVPLWSDMKPASRFDIGRHLNVILPKLKSGELKGERVQPTGYDAWLEKRLITDEDDGWLGGVSPHAAAIMAGLLGNQILFHQGATASDAIGMHRAQSIGFEVISSGPNAIRRCFEEISGTAKGPAPVFGVMLRRFDDLYISEPSFEPFTDILRDFIIDRWPSYRDTVVLGKQVEAQPIANTVEIARSLRRHPTYVRNAMKAVKASSAPSVSEGITRSKAKLVENVLAQADGLISGNEMMKLLGVRKHEWDALRAGGFIKPRLHSEKMRKVWHPDDAESFLRRLKGASPLAWDGGPDWRRISPGAASAKVPYEVVLEALLDGKMQICVNEDHAGLAGIYVSRQNLAKLFASREAE